MEPSPSWASVLHDIIKKTRKPLAYFLVFSAFGLRFTPWHYTPEITLAMLGFILLQAFFEIHNKITESNSKTTFDDFHGASSAIHAEIEKLSEVGGNITIRYLGLAGYHWQYIESNLVHLLKHSRISKISFQFITLDPNWEGIDMCNPAWKNLILGTTSAVNHFKFNHKADIDRARCSIEYRYYQSMPQVWGILINDAALFYSMAYWDNDHLRGGHNPIEVIKSKDSSFGMTRIKEFNGWFDYFWAQQSESKVLVGVANESQ